jgi:hypothetical protein
MERPEGESPRGKRALGLSVLLHVGAAPLFVAVFAGSLIPVPETISVTSGALPATIEHRAPRQAPSRAVARQAAPRKPASEPVSTERATRRIIATSARKPLGSPTHAPPRLAIAIPTPVPSPSVAASAAVPAQSAEDTASAAPPAPAQVAENPEPKPSAAVVLARSIEPAPAGGWGQNFRDPTVLDDSALAALHARYRGAATVRVDVDEDGHATRVSIDGSHLDADARADIERELLTLRYVPAECNGLRCAASLELRV